MNDDVEELKTQMVRLQAMMSAQQHLLLALFQSHPDKSNALRLFRKDTEETQGLFLFEEWFTEEDIEAERTACNFLERLMTDDGVPNPRPGASAG